MQIIDLETIRSNCVASEVIDVMREALVAQARGECDTPMPMHLAITPENAEVHIKSSYRQGGPFFAVKIAAGFPNNLARGLSVGSGMMLLLSAATGEPIAVLADDGYLTDARTAAVSALVTRELGREDTTLGIVGSGIQARLQAQMHAEVLDLQSIWVWGRNAERVRSYVEDMSTLLPGLEVSIAATPSQVAQHARLITTVTAAREPLLMADELQPGTHIAAVGSDSTGKQELDPEILDRAALLLVDSLEQCASLGELQHALGERERAIEAGEFCQTPVEFDRDGLTVGDFTGLGVEDLFVAQYIHGKMSADPAGSEGGK